MDGNTKFVNGHHFDSVPVGYVHSTSHGFRRMNAYVTRFIGHVLYGAEVVQPMFLAEVQGLSSGTRKEYLVTLKQREVLFSVYSS